MLLVLLQLLAEFHQVVPQAAEHRLVNEWRGVRESLVKLARSKSRQDLQQLVMEYEADEYDEGSVFIFT